jgi:hypothetical protein
MVGISSVKVDELSISFDPEPGDAVRSATADAIDATVVLLAAPATGFSPATHAT